MWREGNGWAGLQTSPGTCADGSAYAADERVA